MWTRKKGTTQCPSLFRVIDTLLFPLIISPLSRRRSQKLRQSPVVHKPMLQPQKLYCDGAGFSSLNSPQREFSGGFENWLSSPGSSNQSKGRRELTRSSGDGGHFAHIDHCGHQEPAPRVHRMTGLASLNVPQAQLQPQSQTAPRTPTKRRAGASSSPVRIGILRAAAGPSSSPLGIGILRSPSSRTSDSLREKAAALRRTGRDGSTVGAGLMSPGADRVPMSPSFSDIIQAASLLSER